MHFSLLDIFLNSDFAEDNRLGTVKFAVIDYTGAEVMSAVVNLTQKRSCDVTEHPGTGDCEPIRGPVPYFKELCLRFVLIAPIVFFCVLPLLYACWLVFASIYYIFWVTELKRRERIEAEWKRIKKIK